MKSVRHSLTLTSFLIPPLLLLLPPLCIQIRAQSTTSIEGRITDQNGGLIANAEIKAINRSIAVERTVTTDGSGRYQINALPVGEYRIEVRAKGFQTEVLTRISLEVARRIAQDFQLHVGDASAEVTITGDNGT